MLELIENPIIKKRKKQKCGPKCWNAKGAKCECVCEGINHGISKDKKEVDRILKDLE